MVKIVDKQTSFNFGIVTEKLRARDDLKQYSSAVADAYNFIASKYGPIQKRVGTKYVLDVGHVGEKVRLIPFVLSMKRSFILEFRPLQIRIYTFSNGELVPLPKSATDPSQRTVTTPFTAEMLDGLSYAQSLNALYITVPNGTLQPMVLKRTEDPNGYDNWTISRYTSFEDGPYLDANYDPDKTVAVSAARTGSITVTTTGFTLTSLDVGRHIRINNPDETTLEDRWGWGKITAVNGNSLTVRMYQKAWATTATSEWRLGAWGDPQGSEVGWPSLVTIHEQRLCWQGNTNYPWLWMSNSFNYNNYSPSDYSGHVTDSNAIAYNMATDKIAPVKWLASLGSLLIGTEMYEMRMYSAGAGLAPGDCVVRKESTYGVHDALPIITDDTLIFIQRLQRALRSVSYDYTRDAYVGPELSILAESLTTPGLKRIVYQREPNALIWALLEDGTLLAITYDKEQDVTAWTRVEIAGTDSKVVDLVVVPSSTNKQDMLVLYVERTINGLRRRYAEVLSKEYLKDVPLKDVTFLDSAIRYQGASTKTIGGLTHLRREFVRVTDRGGIHEDVQVDDDGVINLQYPISDGWIGLPYEAYFETLERDFGDAQISSKSSRLRIHRLVLYLIRTLGLTVHQQTRGIETELITFSPLSNMDTPPEPITDQREIDIMTAWTSSDMNYTLVFRSDPGLPCTVGGIFAGVEINAL